MQQVSEPVRPELGSFDVTVYNAGRHGRQRSSRFTVRCDALGLDNDEILLLSVVGPETSVKALTAGLRSARQDQQRIDYAARVGDIDRVRLVACPDGYRVCRARLPYGLWHVLCLARRDGFLPVLTEESLWQQLRGERFTTPLLREWTPWLYRTMKERGLLTELTQSGCQAGLLRADSDALDALVCEGLQKGHLAINGRTARSAGRVEATGTPEVQVLDQYLLTYGSMLGQQAERALQPLHVPGRDACPALDLLREPFEAQAHAVEAARKALGRQKALLLVGEMGTGKTLMALAACHAHAAGRPYRALVFCPGQLVGKWAREIRETLPEVEVIQIESWTSLLRLDRGKKPGRAQWYVLARDRAKLGSRWRPAFQRRLHADNGFLRCPRCGLRLVNEDREPLSVGRPATEGRAGTGLWKNRSRCEWVLTNQRGPGDPELEEGDRLVEGCGSPLWQMTGELWRYEPALFIKRHLRHFFTYLILDEVHEEKGSDTA